MAFRKADYPADWPAIRERIRQRALNRCERCGVPNHAVIWRAPGEPWMACGGNETLDAAGAGELSYREAREVRDELEFLREEQGCDGRWLVVVCTTAHVHDPDKRNCDPANLEFLCQKCHLAIDRPHHLAVQRRNREARKRAVQPVLFEEE